MSSLGSSTCHLAGGGGEQELGVELRAHHHRPSSRSRPALPVAAESLGRCGIAGAVGLGLAGGPSIRLVVVERLDAGKEAFPATAYT